MAVPRLVIAEGRQHPLTTTAGCGSSIRIIDCQQ
jgi:hypothetical protein